MIGDALLFIKCKSKSTKTRLGDNFEYHIISTKIKVFSLKSNYQELAFQAPFDLHESGYNNTFIFTSDLILVPIRKSLEDWHDLLH